MSFFIIYYCECVWGFSLASSYLSFEEWYSLIASISDEKKKLIFEILYSTGCSESELISIKFSDVNFSNCMIKIKNRLSRIPFQLISKLELMQKKENSKKSDYIFSSRQSPSISTKRLQQIVSEESKNCFERRITPQDIRTTHVCHAILKNQPILSISNQTGLSTQRIAQVVEEYKEDFKKNAFGYEL